MSEIKITLTAHEMTLFAYHIGCIYRDKGKFGLSAREGIYAEVSIESGNLSKTDGDIWDQVNINGHWCGNRCGGAIAYARMVAGDPDWHKPYIPK